MAEEGRNGDTSWQESRKMSCYSTIKTEKTRTIKKENYLQVVKEAPKGTEKKAQELKTGKKKG